MQSVNVSVYFMWEWWEKYFHCRSPRPLEPNDDALDGLYLLRKRFLFEQFGQFGIGEEHPEMDGNYVNMVTKYGMDLIPYLFGAQLKCQDTGGWMSRPFPKDRLMAMKPVDIADHPFGEWVLKEREKKIKRYGSAEQFLDYEGPTNIAVRMRGEAFYIDLIDDLEFARHQLDVINETIFHIFRFVARNFPVNAAFGLGNCNVIMISPRLYDEVIKPFDIAFSQESASISGKPNDLVLHHCDVKVDGFVDTYKTIPNLKSLQASHLSDITRIVQDAPAVDFLAMLNPREMAHKGMDQLQAELDRAIRLGASELDLWNIDPSTDPARITTMFSAIKNSCAAYGKACNISVIPFCWDELEWAMPQYQNAIS